MISPPHSLLRLNSKYVVITAFPNTLCVWFVFVIMAKNFVILWHLWHQIQLKALLDSFLANFKHDFISHLIACFINNTKSTSCMNSLTTLTLYTPTHIHSHIHITHQTPHTLCMWCTPVMLYDPDCTTQSRRRPIWILNTACTCLSRINPLNLHKRAELQHTQPSICICMYMWCISCRL